MESSPAGKNAYLHILLYSITYFKTMQKSKINEEPMLNAFRMGTVVKVSSNIHACCQKKVQSFNSLS